MKVGVPKEIKTHEYRVGLTPGAVREYVAAGHGVLIEANAGAGIGATDESYRKGGRNDRRLRSRGVRLERDGRKSQGAPAFRVDPAARESRSSSPICIWRRIRSRPRGSSILGARQSPTKL